jgi:hypothetical protein
LSTVLLRAIHGATVENTFFENGDDAITFENEIGIDSLRSTT